MGHAPEAEARQLPELVQGLAAVDIQHGPVDEKKLLIVVPADIETAGHVLPDFLDDGHRLLVQFKMLFGHDCRPPSGFAC